MVQIRQKGELNDLRFNLDKLCTGADRNKKENIMEKREAIKKVINYMTIGMDMSSLFPKVTSAANLTPNDLVLKKMMYLFITTYAHNNPDLGLVTINILQRDCRDQNPTVRGLAIRSLTSLRVNNLLEYMTDPVSKGLSDIHPYVRQRAAMGVLKLYYQDKELVAQSDMMEKVHALIYDTDAETVVNCLRVVWEIEGLDKILNKGLIYNLLNRLTQFSNSAQCDILELVSHYKPENEQEVYDIMNVLDDCMSHSNSGILVGVLKVYLHITLDLPVTHQMVLERVKDPLKSIISRNDPMIAYSALCHALLLIQRAPVLFSQDAQTFYCRFSEPTYVKKLKMEILACIADYQNAHQIVSELSEYVKDENQVIGRSAVKAIGQIALNVPDVDGIIERLTQFLSSLRPHIVAEALIQMQDVFRRFPEVSEVALSNYQDIQPKEVTDPDGRAALVWTLGTFGEKIEEAPYTLETFLETYQDESTLVRLTLLTASTKLLFKRPLECRMLLSSLLEKCLEDEDQDVRDRAKFYLRLLKQGVEYAKRIIGTSVIAVEKFSSNDNVQNQEQVFREFNTLSVIYRKPAATYLDEQLAKKYFVESNDFHTFTNQQDMLGAQAPQSNEVNLLGPEIDMLETQSSSTSLTSLQSTPLPKLQEQAKNPSNFTDLDSLLGISQLGPISNQQLPTNTQHLPVGIQQLPSTTQQPLVNGGNILQGKLEQPKDPLDELGLGPILDFQAVKPQPITNIDQQFQTTQQQLPYDKKVQQGGDLDLGFGDIDFLGPQLLQTSMPQKISKLDAQVQIAPEQFQSLWGSIQVSSQQNTVMNKKNASKVQQDQLQSIEGLFESQNIKILAKGGQQSTFKAYLYARYQGTMHWILAETIFDINKGAIQLTVKTLDSSNLQNFIQLMQTTLQQYIS